MISAEYDRLIEAWIAGKLDAPGTEELFRLAGQDTELAELLQRQQMVNAGIAGDQVLLAAHLNSGSAEAMRTQVAALSRKTMPETVQPDAQLQAELGVEGIPHSLFTDLVKWITGLAVVGVIAAGIVLSLGDSSPSDPSEKGDAISSPEMVSPSAAPAAIPELREEQTSAEEAAVKDRREEGNPDQLGAERKMGRDALNVSASGVNSDSSSTPSSLLRKGRGSDIPIETQANTSGLP